MTKRKQQSSEPTYEEVIAATARKYTDWLKWFEQMDPGSVQRIPGENLKEQRLRWTALQHRLRKEMRTEEARMINKDGVIYIARLLPEDIEEEDAE